MKTLLSLFAFFSALPAFAANPPWAGSFQVNHPIAFLAYANATDCLAAEGAWVDGICQFNAADSVTVKADRAAFEVSVSTVTTNGHTCDFEGSALVAADRQLVASANTQMYVPGENGGDGQMVNSFCEVTLNYLDDNTVAVTTLSPAAQCESLCGANARLDIPAALRQ